MSAGVCVRGAAGERRRGSIAALVETAEGEWLVSANHVLAGNGRFLPTADPAHGVYVNEQRVGRTIAFAHLHRSGNRADAAACLLEAPTAPVWPVGWLPSPHPFRPSIKTRVKISVEGRDCLGLLAAVGPQRVSMHEFPGLLGEVEFLDSLLVKVIDAEFARPGNSGGLVVTAEDECRPVGLVIGTSVEAGSDFVVVSPLGPALAALGLPQRILV